MLPTLQRKAVELRVEVVLLVIQNPYLIADLQKPVQFNFVERCQVSIKKKFQRISKKKSNTQSKYSGALTFSSEDQVIPC